MDSPSALISGLRSSVPEMGPPDVKYAGMPSRVTAPTVSEKFTVTSEPTVTVMPLRTSVLKPAMVALTS